MNGKEHRAIIEREYSRLMAEARGEVGHALELAIVERLHVSGWVSSGFVRAPAYKPPRPPKTQPPQIEDPGTGPDTQTSADTN